MFGRLVMAVSCMFLACTMFVRLSQADEWNKGTLTPNVAREPGVRPTTKGVLVADVTPGTPASDAGLRRRDVIEEVNHHPVPNVTEYDRFVRQAGNRQ